MRWANRLQHFFVCCCPAAIAMGRLLKRVKCIFITISTIKWLRRGQVREIGGGSRASGEAGNSECDVCNYLRFFCGCGSFKLHFVVAFQADPLLPPTPAHCEPRLHSAIIALRFAGACPQVWGGARRQGDFRSFAMTETKREKVFFFSTKTTTNRSNKNENVKWSCNNFYSLFCKATSTRAAAPPPRSTL